MLMSLVSVSCVFTLIKFISPLLLNALQFLITCLHFLYFFWFSNILSQAAYLSLYIKTSNLFFKLVFDLLFLIIFLDLSNHVIFFLVVQQFLVNFLLSLKDFSQPMFLILC